MCIRDSSYATLVLGYLENELYSQVFNKMGEEIDHYIYTNWRRFLDDCYINWPYGEDKLRELHDILNSLYGSIQLTAETIACSAGVFFERAICCAMLKLPEERRKWGESKIAG